MGKRRGLKERIRKLELEVFSRDLVIDDLEGRIKRLEEKAVNSLQINPRPYYQPYQGSFQPVDVNICVDGGPHTYPLAIGDVTGLSPCSKCGVYPSSPQIGVGVGTTTWSSDTIKINSNSTNTIDCQYNPGIKYDPQS